MLCCLDCRLTPVLRGVCEEARGGMYTLVLEFETKEQMTLDMWETRLNKIESFFGPGIKAEVSGLSQVIFPCMPSMAVLGLGG